MTMAVLGEGTKRQSGEASDRHAPRRHLGAYLTAAVLLTALGRMVVAWISYDFDQVDGRGDDFFKALYDPRVLLEPEFFNPYVWAFTVALMVTGLVAALNRRAGRGAALLCGFVMFATAARELIGLARSEEFRDWYFGISDLEAAIVGSWVVVLLFSATVVVLMLRAGDRPAAGAAGMPARGSQLYLMSGVLMLILGLALIGWIVRVLTTDGYDRGEYFRTLVDAGEAPFPVFAGSGEFWTAVIPVALLVLGVLALLRRPVVRGASIAVLGVFLYIYVRQMIGMTITEFPEESLDETSLPFPDWDAYTEDTEGWLSLATYVGGSLIAIVVIVMMLRAPEAAAGADAPPVAGGHVPAQPVGQPVPQDSPQPQAQARYDAMPQAPTIAAPPPPAAPPQAPPPPAGPPPAG
ncbi:hypothetical protein [Streptomyces sp. NPDC004134]|uniref:hypothetical protein n=1 Tax=Streptomyces sp. NPDC004134 TaxID=3364691 RepID=UPI003682C796